MEESVAQPIFPPAILEAAKSRRFWLDYFFATQPESEYEDLESAPALFPITPATPQSRGFALEINTVSPEEAYFELNFIVPENLSIDEDVKLDAKPTAKKAKSGDGDDDSEEEEEEEDDDDGYLLPVGEEGQFTIAHDDMAHWHPHVLRWSELDLLCRAIAHNNPQLPHPGLPLLLLGRFTPICIGDDDKYIVSMIDAAWRRIGAFSDKDILDITERWDCRDAGFRWEKGPVAGHGGEYMCLVQEKGANSSRELYSYRTPEFNFPHPQWMEMLTRAEALVANDPPTLSLIPAPPPGRRFYTRRPKLSGRMSLPVQSGGWELLLLGVRVASHVDSVFRVLRLGSAAMSGYVSRNNAPTEYTVDITLYDDTKAAAFRVLKDVLRWAMTPDTLQVWVKHDRYPLDLGTDDDDDDKGSELVFQFARASAQGSTTQLSIAIPESVESRIRSLTQAGFEVAPEPNDSLAVSASDGGKVTFSHFSLSVQNEDKGVVVSIQKLTPGVADALFRLLSEEKLILAPAMLASVAIPEMGGVDKVKTTITATPEELLSILDAGAKAWWLKGKESSVLVP